MVQKIKKRLFLFTQGYPYTWSRESTFISYELEALIESGFEVTVFPLRLGDEHDLVNGYKLDTSIAVLLENGFIGTWMYILASFRMLSHIKGSWKVFSSRGIKALYGMYKYALSLESKKRLLNNFFNENGVDHTTLYYTYWCTDFSAALAMVLSEQGHFGLISRAHGVDLYEERGKVFFRDETLSNLKRLIVPSKYGLDYLIKLYPNYCSKFHYAAIGVCIEDIKDIPVSENIQLASCSTVDDNKRVLEIFSVLEVLSRKHNEIVIQWVHFGEGPKFNQLKKIVEECEVPNLRVELKGSVSNHEILDFYRSFRVDAFITFSRSEGGRPVSVQEAMSFGVPVLASANEGLIETIDGGNGALIPEPLNINDAVSQLDILIIKSRKSNEMRMYTYAFARSNFNREEHTTEFISYLSSIK